MRTQAVLVLVVALALVLWGCVRNVPPAEDSPLNESPEEVLVVLELPAMFWCENIDDCVIMIDGCCCAGSQHFLVNRTYLENMPKRDCNGIACPDACNLDTPICIDNQCTTFEQIEDKFVRGRESAEVFNSTYIIWLGMYKYDTGRLELPDILEIHNYSRFPPRDFWLFMDENFYDYGGNFSVQLIDNRGVYLEFPFHLNDRHSATLWDGVDGGGMIESDSALTAILLPYKPYLESVEVLRNGQIIKVYENSDFRFIDH